NFGNRIPRVPAKAGTHSSTSQKLQDGSGFRRDAGWGENYASTSSCSSRLLKLPKQEIIVANSIDVAALRQWLAGKSEVAFLDVREEGQHGAAHPLLAVNVPYSRLELMIGQLVPRRSCPVVLVDNDDGIAEKASRRLAALGYHPI